MTRPLGPRCHDCGDSATAHGDGWVCWYGDGMPGGGGFGTLCDRCYDGRFKRAVCKACGLPSEVPEALREPVVRFENGKPCCAWHCGWATRTICLDCLTPLPWLEDCPNGPLTCQGCGRSFGITLTAEVRAELARLFPRPKILERYRGDWTPHELAAMAAARPWRVIDRASELPRRARVRWHGGPDVGTLEEVARRGGETRFTYSAAYLVSPEAEPIAPNVPLRPEPYESEALHPFFANLLPEGALYLATAYRLGVRPGDPFGVLLGVGADVMGAVQVVPE